MATNWQDISDQDLADLANKRLGGQGAVVESSRRLRVAIVDSVQAPKLALHKEERAIKWLTVVLVFLTVILVILTVFIVLPEIKALRH